MDEEEIPKITICSKDGKQFQVERNILRQSNLINNIVNDSVFDNEDEQPEPIKLDNITASTLEKILEWMSKHSNEEPKTPDPQSYSAHDKELLQSDKFLETVVAAYDLEIPSLLSMCCSVFSEMMKKTDGSDYHHLEQFGYK